MHSLASLRGFSSGFRPPRGLRAPPLSAHASYLSQEEEEEVDAAFALQIFVAAAADQLINSFCAQNQNFEGCRVERVPEPRLFTPTMTPSPTLACAGSGEVDDVERTWGVRWASAGTARFVLGGETLCAESLKVHRFVQNILHSLIPSREGDGDGCNAWIRELTNSRTHELTNSRSLEFLEFMNSMNGPTNKLRRSECCLCWSRRFLRLEWCSDWSYRSHHHHHHHHHHPYHRRHWARFRR